MGTAKWKNGEKEALYILQKKGLSFDSAYHDDNSRDSMPDLEYTDGRFLEITHTKHDQGKEKKIEMHIVEDAEGGKEKIFLHTEVHTVRNIIQEIVYDKGPKYPDGNTDLFIFVSLEEMDALKYLLHTAKENPAYTRFMEQVLNAPFQTIYLCAWNYDKLTYELNDPELLQLHKDSRDQLVYRFL